MTNGYIVHRCRYHLFWCPQYRSPLLSKKEAMMEKELQVQCTKLNIEIESIRITSRSVYLCVNIPVHISVNDAVRFLKSRTRRKLMKEFPELEKQTSSIWSMYYFASTEETVPKYKITEWYASLPRNQRETKQMRKGKESETPWTIRRNA